MPMSDWPNDNPDRTSGAATGPATGPTTGAATGDGRPDHQRLGAPVDRAQETYRPSPYAAQRTLPHGDVSRDGMSAEPDSSLTTRLLLWGGAAVAAAAVTAGGVLAVRKVADLVSGGDDEPDRDADRAADRARNSYYATSRGQGSRGDRPLAPRFADMSEQERDRMRARQRAREAEMDAHSRAVRASAMRDGAVRNGAGRNRDEDDERRNRGHERPRRDDDYRPSRPRSRAPRKLGLLQEVEQTAARLTGGAESLIGSISAAMAGFKQVAGQADDVLRQFHSTADQIRSFIDTAGPIVGSARGSARGQGGDHRPGARSGPADDVRDANAYRRASRRDMVDLRDDAAAPNPRANAEADSFGDHPADEARTHRL